MNIQIRLNFKFFSLLLVSCVLSVAQAKTFYVNSTADTDDGNCQSLSATTDCTLREAIHAANAKSGPDNILFEIPSSDAGCNIAAGDVDVVCTVDVNSAGLGLLPVITDTVFIDGSIKEGRANIPGSVARPHRYATERPGIEITGYLLPPQPIAGGISLNGVSNATIKGLVINRFGCADFPNNEFCSGIQDINGDGNTYLGNYIGLDATGTRPNNSCDPEVDGCNLVVPGFGNNYGILIIDGNNITIGGHKKNQRNIVSNSFDGMIIGNSNHSKIIGNFVGTNVYGQGGSGQIEEGIDLVALFGVDVSGAIIDSNVVVSSASRTGIRIRGDANSSDNTLATISDVTVTNNLIGIDLEGNPAPNRSGISLLDQVEDAHIGLVVKHGSAIPAPNHIAYNFGSGIVLNEEFFGVVRGVSERNTILFNSIHDNNSNNPVEGLGIAFAIIPPFQFNGQGVTPNDPLDADSGSNGLQNFPLLGTAKKLKNLPVVNIKGSLNSEPETVYLIEFFANDTAITRPDTLVVTDPEQTRDLFSQGKTSLGIWLVKTDIYGDSNFDAFAFARHLPDCVIDEATVTSTCITATATKLGYPEDSHRLDLMDTSEFSPVVVVD